MTAAAPQCGDDSGAEGGQPGGEPEARAVRQNDEDEEQPCQPHDGEQGQDQAADEAERNGERHIFSKRCFKTMFGYATSSARLVVVGRPRTNDDTVKDRLIDSATEMFATRPRESITIRALAAAAGTATAAV